MYLDVKVGRNVGHNYLTDDTERDSTHPYEIRGSLRSVPESGVPRVGEGPLCPDR